MKRLLKILMSATIFITLLSVSVVFAVDNEYGTGLKPMTSEEREWLRKSGHFHVIEDYAYLADELPSAVDNSQNAYFPKIANQKNTNACVGYATTYYQMSYTISNKLGEEYVFNPLWTYSLINKGEDNGAYSNDAYNVISELGAPLYDDFRGNATTAEARADVWRSAMTYRLGVDQEQWKVHGDDGDTYDFINDVKTALYNGKILVTGSNSGWWYGMNNSVELTKDGVPTGEFGIPCIRYNKNKDPGRHFVTIVGYDDDIVMSYDYGNETYSTTGAFKFANSWGTDWGNDGFIWVAYDAFYKNSENRPDSYNGYGFTNSWYDDVNGDQSVYYEMCLDDNYELYNPQYTMSVNLRNTNLQDIILSYKTKINNSGSFNEKDILFNEENIFEDNSHHQFPVSYTGELAVDISCMSDYMDLDDGILWKICSNNENPAIARISDGEGNLKYTLTGTEWCEPHKHIFDKDIKYSEIFEKTKECPICEKDITVSMYKDFNYNIYNTNWTHNGNAVISHKTENGNGYMQIDYDQAPDSKYNYFEVYYNPSSEWKVSGNIYMSYDVCFGGDNEDVILANSDTVKNASRNYVLRVCSRKDNCILQYGKSDGKGSSNRYDFYDYINKRYISSKDKWFTIEFIANISTGGRQNIYVKDRDTGELITKVENEYIANPADMCNKLIIGGSHTVKIDNIIIVEDD